MYLCLDTATTRTSVAVIDRSGVLRAESAVDHSDPGQVAVSQIDAALAIAQISRSELLAVCVGVGPGPYTSTRVGCVVAQTIGATLELPVVGVCTHDAISLQVVDGRAHAIAVGDNWDPHSPFVVATDARRGEVYWAIYDSDGARIKGPVVTKPEVLVAQVGELFGGTVRVGGNGFDRFPEFIESGAVRLVGPRLPSAHWLAQVVGLDRIESVELSNSELVGHNPERDPAAALAELDSAIDTTAKAFTPYPLYLRQPDAKPAAERGGARSTSPIISSTKS